MFGIQSSGKAKSRVGAVLALAAALVGCGSDPVAPSDTLTLEVTAAMTEAIQDEYRAENIYLRVLADFGDVVPFRNVVYAEERHSQSLASLFVRRDLTVPLSDWNLNNVPQFASVTAACAAGVVAELENIAMYDAFLDLALPADVRTVFENNRAASLERHLPAFQNCS
jgi:hypothetical protein